MIYHGVILAYPETEADAYNSASTKDEEPGDLDALR